jgi:hypothetical protein
MKCECGITKDNKVFVCPKHYRDLMMDSSLVGYLK